MKRSLTYDAKGRPLKAGDRVLVPFTVQTIYNNELELAPLVNGAMYMVEPYYLVVHAGLAIRANAGDNTLFNVVKDGPAVKLE